MERFGAMGGASKASDKCSFAKVAGMERFGATGGASSSPTKSESDSANTKPYNHTQALALRKTRGIVRFGKVGGVTISPVVARIFSGDSTSPLTREASVMVQSKG